MEPGDGGDLEAVEVDSVLVGAIQHNTYLISSMKKYFLTDLLFHWYTNNLQSGVAWKVEDDLGGQGASTVRNMVPLLMAVATEEEKAVLNTARPQPHVDQNPWRLAITNAADDIVARFKVNLKNDEATLGIRDANAKYNKTMYVTAVETRLSAIKSARKKLNQPTITSIFRGGSSSLDSSSSSASSSACANSSLSSSKGSKKVVTGGKKGNGGGNKSDSGKNKGGK